MKRMILSANFKTQIRCIMYRQFFLTHQIVLSFAGRLMHYGRPCGTVREHCHNRGKLGVTASKTWEIANIE